jgi:hypothetical protein
VKRLLLRFQSCDQNIKAPDTSLIGYPDDQAAVVFYFLVDLFALPTHWRLLDREPTTGSFVAFPKVLVSRAAQQCRHIGPLFDARAVHFTCTLTRTSAENRHRDRPSIGAKKRSAARAEYDRSAAPF